MPTTRVMIVGLGPIGAGVARQLAARSNFKIVAASTSIRPRRTATSASAGQGKKSGAKVSTDAARSPKAKPQVAVLCTSSAIDSLWPQIAALLPLRSRSSRPPRSSPTPAYPNRPLARKFDAAAKKAKVAVVGTGVNPGFAMDALPLTLTAICERVDSVRVDRIQDARIRRLPFQQKIGAGLTPEQFAEKAKALGAPRRAHRVRRDDRGRPRLEARPHHRRDPAEDRAGAGREPVPAVAPGCVAASCRTASASWPASRASRCTWKPTWARRKPTIPSRWRARRGCTSRSLGGYHGDVATASITVNTIPKLLGAAPGLHTMRSLALPSFAGGK